jgi:hypothetical protein
MKAFARQHFLLGYLLLLASATVTAQEPDTQSAPVQGLSIGGADLTEDSCEVLASINSQSPELREVPGMHVLGRVETDPLVIHSTDEVKIKGVMCWRSEAKLAPNDYLVPHKTGVPLYIKTDTGNDATDRTIALEEVNAGIRVRLLSGPKWKPAEEAEMLKAMALFNKRVAGGA